MRKMFAFFFLLELYIEGMKRKEASSIELSSVTMKKAIWIVYFG